MKELYYVKTNPIPPDFKIGPGTIIPCDEPKEFIVPHMHVFDSMFGGIVFGSSIWWVIDKNNRVIQHTRIKGLLCSCGAVLIFDED